MKEPNLAGMDSADWEVIEEKYLEVFFFLQSFKLSWTKSILTEVKEKRNCELC